MSTTETSRRAPGHLIHLAEVLVLASTIAGSAATGLAIAAPPPGDASPDWFERTAAAHPFGHAGALAASTRAPDWFERNAAAHPNGAPGGRHSL
jgi:hypothetical protein